MGRRIDELRLLRTGAPIEPDKEYVVAGWGSVNEATEGPPIWDVVAYLKHRPAGKVIDSRSRRATSPPRAMNGARSRPSRDGAIRRA